MAGSVGQYTQGWFTWQAVKSSIGTVRRNNYTGNFGMGYMDYVAPAQNNEIVWPLYLDSVTWKVATIYESGPGKGIMTFKFDGTTLGTLDAYSAADTEDIYAEVTGISIATPKAADFTVAMASKNASSTNYIYLCNSHALIRTGGTASTPAGTDTPGYTWELPGAWMGSKANTSWDTRTQASTHLGGGYLENAAVQNNVVSWDIWQDTGTGKFAQVYAKDTNVGIYHIQIDGSDVGTIDGYAAAAAGNVYGEVTGLVVAAAGVKALGVKTATKNASSTAYKGYLNSVKWIRTGA